jgi:uncharacterized protein YjeT (DUF2065 family)
MFVVSWFFSGLGVFHAPGFRHFLSPRWVKLLYMEVARLPLKQLNRFGMKFPPFVADYGRRNKVFGVL